MIIVHAISISFDLFSLLCHDSLVGENVCYEVFGVLPHGGAVAIPHNIHLPHAPTMYFGVSFF